jgi:hypothetical protein
LAGGDLPAFWCTIILKIGPARAFGNNDERATHARYSIVSVACDDCSLDRFFHCLFATVHRGATVRLASRGDPDSSQPIAVHPARFA